MPPGAGLATLRIGEDVARLLPGDVLVVALHVARLEGAPRLGRPAREVGPPVIAAVRVNAVSRAPWPDIPRLGRLPAPSRLARLP